MILSSVGSNIYKGMKLYMNNLGKRTELRVNWVKTPKQQSQVASALHFKALSSVLSCHVWGLLDLKHQHSSQHSNEQGHRIKGDWTHQVPAAALRREMKTCLEQHMHRNWAESKASLSVFFRVWQVLTQNSTNKCQAATFVDLSLFVTLYFIYLFAKEKQNSPAS